MKIELKINSELFEIFKINVIVPSIEMYDVIDGTYR